MHGGDACTNLWDSEIEGVAVKIFVERYKFGFNDRKKIR